MIRNLRAVTPSPRSTPSLPLAVLVLSLGLVACGEKSEEKPATQVAVRVNKSDITVHQLNQAMQQQRVAPDQVEETTRRTLEQLIDQELSMSKAKELELDRDPRVVLNLDAAKREVLARAYIEHVAQAIPKASDESVQKYFEQNPALFSNRRVFRMQEIAIAAPEDALATFRAQLASTKSAAELANWAKSKGWRVGGGQVTRSAEQIPLTILPKLAKLQDGEKMELSDTPPFRALFLLASRSQPATFEQAKPSIEQFLTVEARRKAVETNIKALRAASKIEYQGKFAESAPTTQSVSTKDAALDVSVAASGVQVNLPENTASSAQVNLGGTGGGVQINLDKTSAGAQVQLPQLGASAAAGSK